MDRSQAETKAGHGAAHDGSSLKWMFSVCRRLQKRKPCLQQRR